MFKIHILLMNKVRINAIKNLKIFKVTLSIIIIPKSIKNAINIK